MLYLAEVHKQKSGFMGAGKAEIKLLAFQRADQSWNAIAADELIATEEANNFQSGTLVLADLNANRQVQRIQEAGRPLVSILQNFSRVLEKAKRQEEEIEQWKQSLSYQSQELNRRNMEMEARLEQLQQMEHEFQHLEAQQEEFNAQRQETQRLRQELEGAWEHLRGEQRRLQEKAGALDASQVRELQALVARLADGVAVTQTVKEQVNLASEIVATKQGILDYYWQQLEAQNVIATELQDKAVRLTEAVQTSFDDWQRSQTALAQASLELQLQTAARDHASEYAQMLQLQLRQQDDVAEQLAGVNIDVNQKINLAALEQMPLDQLQQLIQDLQLDLAKNARFVNDQEEELRYQQQAVEELRTKLSQATEAERVQIETELAEEKDRYQMLNETLIGQRQNLRSRQHFINQHSRVFLQRQGFGAFVADEQQLDIKPLLAEIDVQKQQQTAQLQKLEQQILQLEAKMAQTQLIIDAETEQLALKQQQLQALEQDLMSVRITEAEAWGKVNSYQELLQPLQDKLNSLRQHIDAIAANLESSDDLQTITDIRQMLLDITPTMEMATI